MILFDLAAFACETSIELSTGFVIADSELSGISSSVFIPKILRNSIARCLYDASICSLKITMTVVAIAARTRNIINGKVQPDRLDEFDEFDEFDELFLFALELDTFVKIFAFFLEFAFLLEFVEKGIKLFAIGATEFIVVVAIEFRAFGTEDVAKFETEFIAFGTEDVAKSETEFRADTVAFGIVVVAKFVTEFKPEFKALGIVLVANTDKEFKALFAALFALFAALVRLDTVFIAELSTVSCQIRGDVFDK